MTEQQRVCAQSYVALVNDLLAGKIEPRLFEATYLEKFKSEQIELPEGIFEVLDILFGDVDAYCADPSIRGADGIGDEELLASARKTLEKLKKLL